MSENYILQELVGTFEAIPRYWSDDNSRKELDFIIQHENDIFPIEAKSEKNVESYSLKYYNEQYADKTKLRIRFSMKNLKMDNNLINIPLFMADYLEKIIEIGLEK